MRKGILLLPALAILLLSGCSQNWTADESRIIDSESDTLHVYTVDNPEEEALLRSKSKKISPDMIRSEEYNALASKMVATVTSPSQDGVGIAGPQVGILRRIVAVQRFDKNGEPFEVYPNVSITKVYGDSVPGPEGCLSLPDRQGEVYRWQDIEISYSSPRTLRDTTERITGFTAVIFQHECDHLNGILYTDKLSDSCSNDEVDIRSFGVRPGTGKDVTVAFRAALQKCREDGIGVLHLENGVYDFWPEDATEKEIFVSNTSSEVECPSKIKVIGLLLENQHNLTIDGHGAELRFHGRQTMVGIIHSSGIRLRNLHIDCERPGASEMLVEKVEKDGVILRFHQSSWYEITPERRLELVGEGWKTEYPHCVEYDKKSGHMNYSSNWDIVQESRAEEIEKGLVKIFTGHTSSFKKGNIITVRDRIRDQVGILNLESEDLKFEDMGIHSLHAIGVVSQFCRNLSFRNVRFEPGEGSGRILASSADFLHFSGCAGKINVQGCRFSGAQDDPINIHGTYLVLEEIVSDNRFRLRFAHHQTYGMQAFWPGDTVSFVNRKSLQTAAVTVVDSVSRLSDREVLLTVHQRVPREIRAGEYVVENLTWTPEVDISDNYFTRTNTRGTLITTPRKAVIRNNVYEKVGMSAILISGDANGWYESGAVKDVTIKDNRFIDCAYSNGTGGAVILIEPSNSVEDPPVHDTIRIISNKFESEGRKPVVSKSVRSLIIL